MSLLELGSSNNMEHIALVVQGLVSWDQHIVVELLDLEKCRHIVVDLVIGFVGHLGSSIGCNIGYLRELVVGALLMALYNKLL